MNARQKMLDRVRAILAKTMANGCTEGEAMSALEKARELMAAYEISEAELGHTTPQEGATIHKSPKADQYNIRKSLAVYVARFTGCKCWKGDDYGVAFCGLETDVAFSNWLLDTLQAYVLRALKSHLAERKANGLSNPRIISSSFVSAACVRIGKRLAELAPTMATTTSSTNGNALVSSRNALIDATMAAAGIRVSAAKHRKVRLDASASNAGYAAGNGARFDRPVASGGRLCLT